MADGVAIEQAPIDRLALVIASDRPVLDAPTGFAAFHLQQAAGFSGERRPDAFIF
jgi:hypothetical protein